MGERGPKPLNIVELSFWEHQFVTAFHLLRDGTPFPSHLMPRSLGMSQIELKSAFALVSSMTSELVWRVTRKLAFAEGEKINLSRPPQLADLEGAANHRAVLLAQFRGGISTPRFDARARSRSIWDALVAAKSYADLKKACGRWARLPDVRRSGRTPIPGHVLANAVDFLSMKNNVRFPRARDMARVDYLARGMAGILVGRSPMTGIERLRTMKHTSSGPLWIKTEQRCACWRCCASHMRECERQLSIGYEAELQRWLDLARAECISSKRRR